MLHQPISVVAEYGGAPEHQHQLSFFGLLTCLDAVPSAFRGVSLDKPRPQLNKRHHRRARDPNQKRYLFSHNSMSVLPCVRGNLKPKAPVRDTRRGTPGVSICEIGESRGSLFRRLELDDFENIRSYFLAT